MPDMTYGEIMDLIRELRHDFLNNIQVIMGNLQLKKPDRAEEYCRQVIGQILPLGPLGKLDNPYLSLTLLLLLQRSKSLGVDLRIDIAPGLTSCADHSAADSDDCRILAEYLMDRIAMRQPADSWLQLDLCGENGHSHWELQLAPGPDAEEICRGIGRELAGDFSGELVFSPTSQAVRLFYRLAQVTE